MSLLPLYTGAAAMAGGTDYGDTELESVDSQFYYVPMSDAIFHAPGDGVHRIYRDGSSVRLGEYVGYYYYYDRDAGLPMWRKSATERVRIDPVTYLPDPGNPAPGSASFTPDVLFSYSPAILRGGIIYYLQGNEIVWTKNATSGAAGPTYDFGVGFADLIAIDGIWFTEDGQWMYVTDGDNEDLAGAGNGRGILRAWNLITNTLAFEWRFARSWKVAYDHVNDQLWTVRVADKKVVIYALTPAPASFTPFTVGTNRARYKEDAITATLVGSEGEVVPNWPVGWTLANGQGDLEHYYTVTDENGVTTNKYCGPGTVDFQHDYQVLTGAFQPGAVQPNSIQAGSVLDYLDQTITAWTAY